MTLFYIANTSNGARYVGTKFRGGVKFSPDQKPRLYTTYTAAREQLCTVQKDLSEWPDHADGWIEGDHVEIREAEVIFK